MAAEHCTELGKANRVHLTQGQHAAPLETPGPRALGKAAPKKQLQCTRVLRNAGSARLNAHNAPVCCVTRVQPG